MHTASARDLISPRTRWRTRPSDPRGERPPDRQPLEDAGSSPALAFAFVLSDRSRARLRPAPTRLAALTPRDIAKLFEKAPGEQIVLRIIDGWRLTEVATAVNKAFPSITKEAFTSAAVVGERKNTVLAGMEPQASLEGYLFPDTYFMRPDMTAPQIVGVLLDTFERKVGATLRAASADRNVSIYDIVKLASIVEREARDRAESATIAGVYTNRLEIGMKLDADHYPVRAR